MINKSITYLLLLLALNINAGLAQVDVKSNLRAEIQKIIDHDSPIDYTITPGFVISIIHADQEYFLDYESPLDSTKNFTPRSRFELGGVSKIFTTNFFIDWINKDQAISFDTQIRSLDNGYTQMIISEKNLAELLSFKTSFPKRLINQSKSKTSTNPYSGLNTESIYSSIISSKNHQHEDKSAYSHINYCLMDHLYASINNQDLTQDLGDFLQKQSFTYTSFVSDVHFEPGIDRNRELAKPWDLHICQSSEGLISNTYDINMLLKELMNNEKHIALLKEHSSQSIYRPSFYMTMGWSIIKGVGKFDIFAMTGKTSGHSSFVAFIPETKTAVTILSNSSSGTQDLGILILRMINNNFK